MAKEEVLLEVRQSYNRDGALREELFVNGKSVLSAYPLYECPEDATLERDMLGPSDFVELLEQIVREHNGKVLKVIYTDEDDDE